jgi:hypothetical protein
MPDISMCRNEECPLKDSCYRYVAEPSHYQAYGKFEYKDGCDHYLKFHGSRPMLNHIRDILNGK